MAESISESISKLIQKRSIAAAFNALFSVIIQHRMSEVFYSLLDILSLRASEISNLSNDLDPEAIFRISDQSEYAATIGMGDLSDDRKTRFPVQLLPADLNARIHAIASSEKWMVIGEYSESSARLFYLNSKECVLLEDYLRKKGILHIHSILKVTENEVTISTGDSSKVLDQWEVSSTGMKFVRRLLSRHAGFTTCAVVNGKSYYGTDFSQRPNYIFRLDDRRKWAYPIPSFRKYTVHWKVIEDRYIVSLNKDLEVFGGEKALSVFDTKLERFIASRTWTGDLASRFLSVRQQT